MSHAAIDEAASLRRLIAAADAHLADLKTADIVDMRAVADAKRHRETLLAELEMTEARAK